MNDQPGPSEARALLFEQMAAQIRMNKDAIFGGAFLMVPLAAIPSAPSCLTRMSRLFSGPRSRHWPT